MDELDRHRTPSQFDVSGRFKAVLSVTVVILFALVLGELLAVFPYFRAEMTTGTVSNLWMSVTIAMSFAGMFAAGVVYLVTTSRGVSYIDLQKPTLRTAKYAVLGAGVAFAVMLVLSIVSTFLEIPTGESWVTDEIGSDMQMALLFLLIVFLFNAPAEEFLFRNVVQKRLAETFSTVSAILVTSTLFAVAHIPGYLFLGTVVEAAVPVTIIFLGSVIFGVVYAETRDLVSVTLAHALYNAVQISLYILTLMW